MKHHADHWMAAASRHSLTLPGTSILQLTGMKPVLRLLFGALTVYDYRRCDYRVGERGKLAVTAFGTSDVNIAEQSPQSGVIVARLVGQGKNEHAPCTM